MKANEILQGDVQNATQWKSLLNAVEIGSTTKDNDVILESPNESAAKNPETVTINLPDIGMVINKNKIHNNSMINKNDNEIQRAFKRNTFLKNHLQRLTEMCESYNSFL
ncbi:MAG: hypothetical protein SFU99_11170 [Saprospiraceae bacterium]|nr:hypothetical protein [Saprospiraceae bacterium]